MALKTCLSPAHWVALAINHLKFLLARNVILKVIVVDIVLFSLLMTFFVVFKEITDLHGIILKGWLSYAAFSALCILFSIFGFIAVFRRKVRLTQIYFGLFVLSLLFCILVSIPIFDVECGCDNFRGCHDLKAFRMLKGNLEIHNKYMAPKGWPGDVLVPYREPPADSHPVPTVEDAGSSFLEVNAEAVSDPDLIMSVIPRSHQSFIQKRRGRGYRAWNVGGRAGGEHLRVAELLGDGAIQANDEDPQPEKKPTTDKKESEEDAKQRKKKDPETLRRATERSMAFYTPVDHHIRMTNAAGHSSSSCPKSDIKADYQTKYKPMVDAWNKRAVEGKASHPEGTVTGSDKGQVTPAPNTSKAVEAIALLEAFEDPPAGIQAISDQEILYDQILAYLWRCLGSEKCEGVLTYAINKQNMYVCEYSDTDLVPSIASEKELQDSKEGVFWMKRKTEVARDRAGGQKKYLALKEAVGALQFPEEVKTEVDKLEDQCRCQDTSCNYYKDKDSNDEKFWCYVDERMTSKCQKEGIALLEDPKGKLWSKDLCSKEQKCECSNRGNIPYSGTQVNESKYSLDQNKLNYGSRCAQWNVGNSWEWCYVGVDTTCADRVRSRPRAGQAVTQFWSQLPCEHHRQAENVRAVKEMCDIFTRLGMTVVILIFIKFLPMGVVLFAFLANRCGDHVEDQEQWEILDSEEEDTDRVQDKDSEAQPAAEASAGADGAAAGGTGGDKGQGVRFKD